MKSGYFYFDKNLLNVVFSNFQNSHAYSTPCGSWDGICLSSSKSNMVKLFPGTGN